MNLYGGLWKRRIFAFTSTSNFFVDMKTSIEIKGKMENYTIPKELMIVDSEENINFLKELNTLFSENFLVLGEKLNFLSERKQWCFRRNGFLTLISPILSGLMESGIYKRWEYFSKAMSTYWEVLETKNKLIQVSKGSKNHFSLRGNILAYLLFKPHTAKPSGETGEPITLEFFAVLITLFGYCVAFCSAVFLIESLSKIKVPEKVYKLYFTLTGFSRKIFQAFPRLKA